MQEEREEDGNWAIGRWDMGDGGRKKEIPEEWQEEEGKKQQGKKEMTEKKKLRQGNIHNEKKNDN